MSLLGEKYTNVFRELDLIMRAGLDFYESAKASPAQSSLLILIVNSARCYPPTPSVPTATGSHSLASAGLQPSYEGQIMLGGA